MGPLSPLNQSCLFSVRIPAPAADNPDPLNWLSSTLESSWKRCFFFKHLDNVPFNVISQLIILRGRRSLHRRGIFCLGIMSPCLSQKTLGWRVSLGNSAQVQASSQFAFVVLQRVFPRVGSNFCRGATPRGSKRHCSCALGKYEVQPNFTHPLNS